MILRGVLAFLAISLVSKLFIVGNEQYHRYHPNLTMISWSSESAEGLAAWVLVDS
jgi:hypothetical protein